MTDVAFPVQFTFGIPMCMHCDLVIS